jgi:hypothetical protein
VIHNITNQSLKRPKQGRKRHTEEQKIGYCAEKEGLNPARQAI